MTEGHTAIKVSRSGGQAQGTLMGTPWALGIPSQSPVPVGFRPGGWPRSGTRAGSTPPGAGAGAGEEAGTGAGAGAEEGTGAGAGAGAGVPAPASMAFA